MVYEKRFSNGLRLVVKRMEGLLSVSCGILVGTGSCIETDAEDGISHFIEHMQFKGTKKRNAFEISYAFDRIGAQVNAFTGKDSTCFYTKCTSDHVSEAFEALSDIFLNATYPEDEMVREKGVICEEISMNEDTPDELCFDVLANAFYGNENYGRNILGTPENVNSFTKEAVDKYKKARYTPDNIVISFAGGIDFATAQALVETYFGCLENGKLEKRDKKLLCLNRSLIKTKPVEQMHIAIGYPTLERDNKLIDAAQAMNVILGGGMSSRLFQNVREKMGLAYSVYSYISAFEESGILVLYAGINPKNTDKAYDAINKTVNELVKNGISDDEFLRGREQMKSSMLFSQESTSSQMLLYGKYMLQRNTIFDFEGKLNDINKITKDDVMQTVKLTFENGNKSVGAVGNSDKAFTL